MQETEVRGREVRLALSALMGLGLLLGVVLAAGARGREVRASAESTPSAAGAASSARRWLSETVDSANDVGQYSSLALEPVWPYTPHVSYYDASDTDLKHAWRTPSGWSSETVDDSISVGRYTSLALAPTPPYTPHISYYDAFNTALKHAWRTPSGWLSETVDNSAWVGEYSSLALEPAEPYTVHISYRDEDGDSLKHAWLSGSTWYSETVDDGGNVGRYTSLALAPTTPYTPHISYFDDTNGALKHAWLSGSTWYSETVEKDTVHPNQVVGEYSSLALDPAEPYAPRISYYNSWPEYDLKYAWLSGTTWLSVTVDTEGLVGDYTSLALESSPPYYPHIGYRANTASALRHAWLTAGGWLTETVDTRGTPGQHGTSLALGPAPLDIPHITYYDDEPATKDLKHAWLESAGTYLPLVLREAEG